MHEIFISYRRADSFAYAKAIAERLCTAFGEQAVFFDIDTIQAGDEHGVLVIPVLVGGASMPAEDELPDALRPLCRRQAVEIRDAHFNDDVEALIVQLQRTGLRRLGSGTKRAVSGLSVIVVLAFLITMALELSGNDSDFVKTLKGVSLVTLIVASGLRLYFELFRTTPRS